MTPPTHSALQQALDRLIRRVPDFPKPGILFYDIMPLLADAAMLGRAVAALCEHSRSHELACVVAVETRGLLLGILIAQHLGLRFVPLRKPGRLPGEVIRVEYALAYGSDALEIQRGAVQPGERVLLVDDVLATGGTAEAACALLAETDATVAAAAFLIILDELGGAARLGEVPLHALLHY